MKDKRQHTIQNQQSDTRIESLSEYLPKDKNHLEIPEIIRTKKYKSLAYIGKLPVGIADDIQNHIEESRRDWDRGL
jgi:hypothetical protein